MNIHTVTLFVSIALAGSSPTPSNDRDLTTTASMSDWFEVSNSSESSSLQLGLLSWIRADGKAEGASLTIPIARPYLSARFNGGETRVDTQVELADASSTLLDLEVSHQLDRSITLSIGKFRPHFSRGWRTGLPALALPSRGFVQDTYHPSRAIGASIHGALAHRHFDYFIGGFAEPQSAEPDSVQPILATIRMVWSPLGATPYTQTPWFEDLDGLKLAIGANAMTRSVREAIDEGEQLRGETTFTASCDLAVMSRTWALTTEAFVRQQQANAHARDHGAYVLVSTLLPTRRALDVSARLGLHDTNNASLERAYELGVGFYPTRTQRLKASLSMSLADQENTTTYNLNAQLQLWL